ncbi:MAG: glycoside hydrolase family 3 C-terminal domain-containing protein, partial [Verrucomicrobia bacterium]|nr:glycoside hydrolase family 3 C-terminal domain-containing protein [Verrucomicrobiota bacterium]
MKLINLHRVTLTGLFICTLNVHAEQGSNNVEQRVNNILAQMTLDEKLSYIGGTYTATTYGVFNIRGIPRLGLPEIDMCNGPLGIQSLIGQASTRYPAGLALAATWNRKRALLRGRQMGRDGRARAFYVDLGPGVDPYRTPLGGRNFEYNTGEDPFLGAQLVAPLISAMQEQGIWADVKHYACNEQEYRRENINILVDERPLREIYLPPFEGAVKQGHTASVMGALNAVNGDFACESLELDTTILKREWGFDGVLLSDYQGIHDGVKAAKAGMDLDMPFGDFMNPQTLLPAIQSGQISVSTIDDKVRRILRKIVAFGFLDRPQLDSSIPLDDPASSLEALDEAREGIVLLKNEKEILPFDRSKVRSIAVLGRLAPGIPATGFGSSFLDAIRSISELSGISQLAGPTVKVDFITAGSPDPATAAWQFLTTGGTFATGLQGQYFTSNDLSGSPALTRIDPEVNFDWTVTGAIPPVIPPADQATFSARWTGQVRPTFTGDHLFKVRADGGIRLYVNSQLLVDTFLSPMPPPFYGTTIPSFAKIYLQAGQAYDVRLEYRRTTGFPGNSGALQGVQFSWAPLVVPPELSTYDAVVMCQGIDNEYDGEGLDLAFKFEDQGLAGLERAIIMPEFQDELIQNVLHTNPRTVVVLHGTGNFNIQSWINQVPALLHAWYPGENGGQALGEILFGQVNPSGKLPITMEKSLADNPTTANYPTTSDALSIRYTEGLFVGYRGYEENHIQPQYPFGYGLSYTTFAYSDLKIAPPQLNGNNHVTVSFTVTNTGNLAGAEIAELYVGQQNPPITRPIK